MKAGWGQFASEIGGRPGGGNFVFKFMKSGWTHFSSEISHGLKMKLGKGRVDQFRLQIEWMAMEPLGFLNELDLGGPVIN